MRDSLGGSKRPTTGEMQASFRFPHRAGGGGVRGQALKSPFVPQEGVIWANTHSHILTSHSHANTDPLSSESRVKALFLRSVLRRSSPGSVQGKGTQTPAITAMPSMALESCPNASLSSGSLSEFLPTTTLFPTSKFPHQYVLSLQFHLESEQFFSRLFLVA